MDDVINVSGHRIGTAEVESALVAHAKVQLAAVASVGGCGGTVGYVNLGGISDVNLVLFILD